MEFQGAHFIEFMIREAQYERGLTNRGIKASHLKEHFQNYCE